MESAVNVETCNSSSVEIRWKKNTKLVSTLAGITVNVCISTYVVFFYYFKKQQGIPQHVKETTYACTVNKTPLCSIIHRDAAMSAQLTEVSTEINRN